MNIDEFALNVAKAKIAREMRRDVFIEALNEVFGEE